MKLLRKQQPRNPFHAGQWFFVAGIFSASFSWQTLLAGVGALAGKRVSPLFREITQVGGSLLIVGLGVAILLNLL